MNSDSSSKTDQEDEPETKGPEIDFAALVEFLRKQSKVLVRESIHDRRIEQPLGAHYKEGMSVAYSSLADRLDKGDFNVGMRKEKKVVQRKATEYRPRSSRKGYQG